jgi:hypothetical protein
LLEARPQAGVDAVGLIPGDEIRVHARVERGLDHVGGQLGLGRERDFLGNSGALAPARIIGPYFRQVEADIDRGMPGGGGEGEVDGQLAVLDPARGVPEYYRWAPTVAVPFLTSPVSSTARTRRPLSAPRCSDT